MSTAGQPITVLIGTFEDIVLRGLRAMVQDDPHLELVAAGVGSASLAADCRHLEPRVALLNFGSLERPAALRVLHKAAPETRLVVLANRPTVVEARQIIGFGATACLSKSTDTRDLVHAIHLASRGMHVLPVEDSGVSVAAGEALTAREMGVLEGLQAGRSNGEIAAELHVSVETVRTHARNIYRKLGVSGRRELRT